MYNYVSLTKFIARDCCLFFKFNRYIIMNDNAGMTTDHLLMVILSGACTNGKLDEYEVFLKLKPYRNFVYPIGKYLREGFTLYTNLHGKFHLTGTINSVAIILREIAVLGYLEENTVVGEYTLTDKGRKLCTDMHAVNK